MRLLITQLLKFNVEYGHSKRNTVYLSGWMFFSWRKKHFIIDLLKTSFCIKIALVCVRKMVLSKRPVLFASLRKNQSFLLARYAALCGESFLVFRWIFGLVSNRKSLTKWDKVLVQVLSQGYKMQIGEKKRIASFIGITSSVYKRQIGCGIFPNIEKSGYIINEFASAGVPLIALVDSNMNSYKISFPIPGNDDSFVSINFFLNVMAKTCLAAKASFVLRWKPFFWRLRQLLHYKKFEARLKKKITNYKFGLKKRALKIALKRKKLPTLDRKKQLIYFFLKNKNLNTLINNLKVNVDNINKECESKKTISVFEGLNEVFFIWKFFKNV